jgi:reductive dehalogenase
MTESGKAKKALSRRDFFKMAGLGTGAAVAVSALAPKEAAAATAGPSAVPYKDPAGRPQRPWWVRTVDQPTTEIDWANMKRYNERYLPEEGTGTTRGGGMAGYLGKDVADALKAEGDAKLYQRILDGVDGYTLKDSALKDAQSATSLGYSFLGLQKAQTPEERGVPKWTGTPAEASKMVRAALRHLGASTVGFLELDDNTRKLIYSVDPDGHILEFTDDAVASETETHRYIPYSVKYVIVYTVQMSEEAMKRSPTMTASQTTTGAYSRGTHINAGMQDFLRALGYQCLGESSLNALAIAPALGVLAGLGEMSRMNRMISPEFGPMVRVFKLLTDLPLEPDKPIDAGIMEFCKHCKKCAEACPSGALSFEDEPYWEVKGGWNNPGHKAWFEDAVKCRTYWIQEAATNCGICFGVCPFAKKDKAWIHEWVRAGTSTAPFLGSFFRTMDDAFGYGVQKSGEEWWNLDQPEYGFDTTVVVGG